MWHMGQQRGVHTNFSRTLSIKRDILYDYRHGDTTCYLGFSAHQAENMRHNTELFFFCFPASREKEIRECSWPPLAEGGSDGGHGVGPAPDPFAARWQRRQRRLVSFSKWSRRLGRRTVTLLGRDISARACSWGCQAGCAVRPGSRCHW